MAYPAPASLSDFNPLVYFPFRGKAHRGKRSTKAATAIDSQRVERFIIPTVIRVISANDPAKAFIGTVDIGEASSRPPETVRLVG